MSYVIEARGLTKRYKSTIAVDNIDLKIPAGRIVGLIGPNGAGKTSVLKAILGLANYEGELSVLGKNPAKDRAALMDDVCFIADVAVLPRWIRVWQLIELTEDIHPKFSREKCLQYLSSTKVTLDHKVKQLSKGMVAQLHLAIVMSIDVKLTSHIDTGEPGGDGLPDSSFTYRTKRGKYEIDPVWESEELTGPRFRGSSISKVYPACCTTVRHEIIINIRNMGSVCWCVSVSYKARGCNPINGSFDDLHTVANINIVCKVSEGADSA